MITDLRKQYLRLQENFTTFQNRSNQRERDLEEAQSKLKKALENQRANYADLRSVVQLNDVHIVKDLVDEFADLNLSIDNVCGPIADHIVDPTANQTLSLARGKLRTLVPQALLDSKSTADVFVFTFLRMHISRSLYDSLVKFHPKGPENDKSIEECYRLVRRSGECDLVLAGM
jgi:hypothetical protein